MGLFSKKKELPLASDPFQGSSSPFEMNDIPPPPSSLQEPIGTPAPSQGSTPPLFPPEFGPQPELPAFESSQQPSSMIPSPPPAAAQADLIPPAPSAPEPVPAAYIPKPEPAFELPDFDDEEISRLEEAEKAAAEHEEPIPEKTARTEWAEEKPEEEPERPFAEYEQISAPAAKFSYPEEEKPAEHQGERFLELKTLFLVKDEIDALKTLFRGFDESIEKYASKEKLEKYHSLTNTLNNIQDKIMTIDSKLFEP